MQVSNPVRDIVFIMEKLSVITSYYNRPENLKRYIESLRKSDKNGVEFWLIEYGERSEETQDLTNEGINYGFVPGNNLFSTAKCHNAGVRAADGRWLLKQDVDCIVPSRNFYQKLAEELKNKSWTYFMNIGVKNYLHGNQAFGNQWVCSKQAYNIIGGEPEFHGYGFEDYVFLYKLAKLRDRAFVLKFNEINVTDVIRDQLARVKNKETDFYMLHKNHRRVANDYWRASVENKRRAFEICRKLT